MSEAKEVPAFNTKNWGFYINKTPQSVTIIIDGKTLESFKELLFRGSNLWVDAPAQIKEFVDLVLEGKALQDYYAQDTSPTALALKKEETTAAINRKFSKGNEHHV